MQTKQAKIKELMMQAIEYPRPQEIKHLMLPIWNQPFFYQIDKARMLTISYNPTDKGAKTNYKKLYREYAENGRIDTEVIYETLYGFIEETYWRKNYNLIGEQLDIDKSFISHMDCSFFPYKTFNDYQEYEYLDDTYNFILQTVEILGEQLKYIFIDGARNRRIVRKIGKGFKMFYQTKMPINSSGKTYSLEIYKNEKGCFLVYFGCFLYGTTCPAKEKVIEIAKVIKEKTQ